MMKRFLAVALFASLAVPAGAAQGNEIAFANYDLDATSYTYGKMGDPVSKRTRVVTTATSTTVTAVDSDLDIFANVTAGDMVAIQQGSLWVYRVVASVTSDDEIEVETAMSTTETATGWGHYFFTSGTGADVGWFAVNGSDKVRFDVQVKQMSVTGQIDVRFECRVSSMSFLSPAVIYTASYTAADSDVYDFENTGAGPGFAGGYDQCRVGMLINSADDGSDTGAALEVISVMVLR